MTPGRTPAPGSLSTVEAFVNTNDREAGTDEFNSADAVGRWLTNQLELQVGRVNSAQFSRALHLREALRELARANATDHPAPAEAYAVVNAEAARSALGVRFGPGAIATTSRSSGFDGAIGLILATVADSMRDGTWHRFKTCRRDICQWTFYDRSPNESGAWCDMAICGSREKAKAYYYRRRAS